MGKCIKESLLVLSQKGVQTAINKAEDWRDMLKEMLAAASPDEQEKLTPIYAAINEALTVLSELRG
jgi:hypothetical protein